MATNTRAQRQNAALYDYTNQCWVQNQEVQPCGHVLECDCYGKAHAGERVEVHTIDHCRNISDDVAAGIPTGPHTAADCIS